MNNSVRRKGPQFSILTVIWNRVGTIEDALRSLHVQTFEDYEHIVQDGGSRDGTLGLLQAVSDTRMQLVSERDDGIYDGLNRAIARSSGEIIGLLHSDDFYANAFVLENVARRFKETGADAVYGDLDYVSSSDSARIIRHWRSGEFHPRGLRRGWMPPHPALFLKRSVVERWGAYDTDFQIAADYDAILRYFGTGGITSVYLPEVLVKMRVGGISNRSIGRIIRKSQEDYRALRKNGIGGVGSLLSKNLRKIAQFLPLP